MGQHAEQWIIFPRLAETFIIIIKPINPRIMAAATAHLSVSSFLWLYFMNRQGQFLLYSCSSILEINFQTKCPALCVNKVVAF